MFWQDATTEFFLDHGIARISKGFSYAAELAEKILDADPETPFCIVLNEFKQNHQITGERLLRALKHFSLYIKNRNPELYDRLGCGESFHMLNFIRAVAEASLAHYLEKHTLLKNKDWP